jgi:glutamate-1-semialdehyde aminotransferase
MFISAAHEKEHIEKTVDAVEKVFKRIAMSFKP